MPPRIYTIGTPANPFLQVIYFLIGGVLLIGAVLMGAVILAIAFGFAIILGIVVFIRVWWLRRKLAPTRTGANSTENVLEVEYTVVDERNERDS